MELFDQIAAHAKLGLVYAAEKGLNSIIKNLVAQGEDINETQNDSTPFLSACLYGHMSTIILLLEFHANPYARNKVSII